MKTERKSELKGVLKGILITLFLLGIFMGGVVYATTVITDENIWIDNNPVIVESDYTEWTHVWTNELPEGSEEGTSLFIDETNEVINVIWRDNSSYNRFGVFTLDDFSTVALSGAGGHYPWASPNWGNDITIGPGNSGYPRSLISYLLITRTNYKEIEVWHGGSQLWTHNITTEIPGAETSSVDISQTGKYVTIFTKGSQLILYEGS